MLEYACRRLEDLVTPFLERKLEQVRDYKEKLMEETNRISTWKCAVCGASGMKSPRYVRSHMSHKHKDIGKDDYPEPIEVVSEASSVEVAVDVIIKAQEIPDVVAEVAEVLNTYGLRLVTKEEVLNEPMPTPPEVYPTEEVSAPTEVEVGTRVELKGPLWQYNVESCQWTSEISDGVRAEVYQRLLNTPSEGVVTLLAKSTDTGRVWSLPEEMVLNGTIPKIDIYGVVGNSTVPSVSEAEIVAEKLEEFRSRAAEYVKARDAFAAQERAFEAVKKEHRDFLVSTIKHLGQQKEGSASFFMEAAGYYSQVVIVPSQPTVEYDKGKIVEFLMEHGLDCYLSDPGFDEDRWNTVKRFTTDGVPVIDEEFVKTVETYGSTEARESLCISTLK